MTIKEELPIIHDDSVVEYKGKLYEVGGRYLFAKDDNGVLATLKGLGSRGFIAHDGVTWPECIAIDREGFGKIKDVPPWKPEKDTLYWARYYDNSNWSPVFHRTGGKWLRIGLNDYFDTVEFTQIEHTPIVRKEMESEK